MEDRDKKHMLELESKPSLKRRILHIVLVVFMLVLSGAAVLIACSVRWALSQWSDLRMDEIVYELTAPLEGTGSGMIGDYLAKCVVPAAVVVVAEMVILILCRVRKIVVRNLVPVAVIIAAVIVGGVFAKQFWDEVGVGEYLANLNTDSNFIEKNYVNPSEVSLTFPEKKRNLIFIYMESTEITFADKANGGAFDENVIPELTALAQENEDFSGADQKLNGGKALPGTTWTMGAIYGTTSGLPIHSNLSNDEMEAKEVSFPEVVTLGDILEDAGYHQVFVLGSDASFGGRKSYFQQHGNYEIRDLLYAKETGRIPEDYYVWWGMEDEKMFQMAKDTLDEYSQEDEPFNVTLLTVDTHFSDGYVCDLCRDEFDEQYSNVYACASRQVNSFVNWCRRQDWYDNTTIVITGDHPTMDADYCSNISQDYVRKTYTCYINAAAQPAEDERRDFSTLDLFPTTLASLGVTIDGNKLGLGTNLFSDTQTLTEIYGEDRVSAEVSRNSQFLNELQATGSSGFGETMTFTDAQKPVITVDSSENTITFSFPDLEIEGAEISQVSVEMWYTDDEQDLYQKAAMTEDDKGTYTATMSLDSFGDVPYIEYQVLVDPGTGTDSAYGEEGKYELTTNK